MPSDKLDTQQRKELLAKAGEFLIGNDLPVTRLGFGAMRITGEGILGRAARSSAGDPGFAAGRRVGN
jgi:hypothetical protein